MHPQLNRVYERRLERPHSAETDKPYRPRLWLKRPSSTSALKIYERASRTSVEALGPDSRRVLRDHFERFDDDEDGFIDGYELMKLMRSLSTKPPSAESIDFLLVTLDTDGDGRLSVDELTSQWRTVISHSVCGEEMMQAFKHIDRDHDGFIRLPELRDELIHRNHQPLSGPEVSALLEHLMKYDIDRDGKFSYAEFVNMYIEGAYPFNKPSMASQELRQYKLEKTRR